MGYNFVMALRLFFLGFGAKNVIGDFVGLNGYTLRKPATFLFISCCQAANIGGVEKIQLDIIGRLIFRYTMGIYL